MSRPARARGLKLGTMITSILAALVAPRAGAWIETYKKLEKQMQQHVAPRAGAWIETILLKNRMSLH